VREQENIKNQEVYWLKQFERETPVLNLLTDYSRPVIQSFEGGFLSLEISSPQTNMLKTIALEEKVTPYMILLAVFNVL
jgi:hypothetical protein